MDRDGGRIGVSRQKQGEIRKQGKSRKRRREKIER